MQRLKRSIAMTVIILFASGVSLIAQGRGGGQKPKTQTSAPKASTGAPKAPQGAKVSAQSSPKATKVPVKTAKSSPPAATKSAKAASPASSTSGAEKSKPAKMASAKKSETSTTSAAAGASTTAGTGTTTSQPVTLTAVQQKLQKNTNLASKLQSRLPGADLMKAADGFRNLGQFVAAVNVSNNLGLDFTQLKMKMVDDGLSLGQSIQALKPAASGAVEAQRAEYEARGMIAETETQVSATATVTTTTTTQKPKGKKSGGSSD